MFGHNNRGVYFITIFLVHKLIGSSSQVGSSSGGLSQTMSHIQEVIANHDQQVRLVNIRVGLLKLL
jgi:hypothetical protein